jgi:hypothetical protein
MPTGSPRPPSSQMRGWVPYAILGSVVGVGIALVVALGLILSGFTPDGTGDPVVTFGHPSSKNLHPGTYYLEIPFQADIGINTSRLYILVFGPNETVPGGSPPPSCAWVENGSPGLFGGASCGSPSGGWYSVLTYPNDVISSVYNGSETDGPLGSGEFVPTVPIGNGLIWWIISSSNLSDGQHSLCAQAIGFAESEACVTL